MKVMTVLTLLLLLFSWSSLAYFERCLLPPQLCVNPPNEPTTPPKYFDLIEPELTPSTALAIVEKDDDKKAKSKKTVIQKKITLKKDHS
ncbi:hypothetical protein KO505_14785 [Psychrosphaera sp. F3M07]|uniref:hypothetical protein n=1 Tax=Psychrosphaera sp. F3M07 TaxID=2841560 RepID=UPI001C08E4C9|nr:hypothetical protein [Psychrosphaera sp. F3M07]MBU2919211.1 hypothetical protein [Psychrosphaera sp. F3M07]